MFGVSRRGVIIRRNYIFEIKKNIYMYVSGRRVLNYVRMIFVNNERQSNDVAGVYFAPVWGFTREGKGEKVLAPHMGRWKCVTKKKRTSKELLNEKWILNRCDQA